MSFTITNSGDNFFYSSSLITLHCYHIFNIALLYITCPPFFSSFFFSPYSLVLANLWYHILSIFGFLARMFLLFSVSDQTCFCNKMTCLVVHHIFLNKDNMKSYINYEYIVLCDLHMERFFFFKYIWTDLKTTKILQSESKLYFLPI